MPAVRRVGAWSVARAASEVKGWGERMLGARGRPLDEADLNTEQTERESDGFAWPQRDGLKCRLESVATSLKPALHVASRSGSP
jgi:hypothetical protein